MSPEHAEDSALLWLCVDVCPHLFGWTVLDVDLPLTRLILNEEILHLDVLGPLQAPHLSVHF
jgi:hypothetical protein